MKLTRESIILLSLICCGTMLPVGAGAQHAATFLNALQMEVTNRVANPPTNSTLAQRRAMTTAGRALARPTRTFAADLRLLASVATALRVPFAGDAAIGLLQTQAVDLYSAEGRARFNALLAHAGTNSFPRSASNQLVRAQTALNRGGNVSNSVPVRARALATGFTKLELAETQIRRVIKAPVSIADKWVVLSEDAIVNDQTIFYLNHTSDALIYNVHNPEELGLWTYQRVSPTAGIVTLTPHYPPGATTPHTLSLVFTNSAGGTFTGQNIRGENVRGTFTVTD